MQDIENWRTVGKVNHLHDYYFQLDKPMTVFRSEVIELEPIWRVRPSKMVQIRDFEIIKCIGTGGTELVTQASPKYSWSGRRPTASSTRSSSWRRRSSWVAASSALLPTNGTSWSGWTTRTCCGWTTPLRLRTSWPLRLNVHVC